MNPFTKSSSSSSQKQIDSSTSPFLVSAVANKLRRDRLISSSLVRPSSLQTNLTNRTRTQTSKFNKDYSALESAIDQQKILVNNKRKRAGDEDDDIRSDTSTASGNLSRCSLPDLPGVSEDGGTSLKNLKTLLSMFSNNPSNIPSSTALCDVYLDMLDRNNLDNVIVADDVERTKKRQKV